MGRGMVRQAHHDHPESIEGSPQPHAPRRVHDCPEPYMVQGSPSPIKGEGGFLEIFIVLVPARRRQG